jgi:transcription initiation factor IIE alpha subunit
MCQLCWYRHLPRCVCGVPARESGACGNCERKHEPEILELLEWEGPMTSYELAERTGLSLRHVIRLCRKLCNEGLVRRTVREDCYAWWSIDRKRSDEKRAVAAK